MTQHPTDEAKKRAEALAVFTDWLDSGDEADIALAYHAETIISALSTDAPPVTGGAWLPIESAPKDGTKVWISRNYNNAPVVLAEWSGKTNDWKTGSSLMDIYVSPTHWMMANIPAPPSSADKEGV